MCAPLIVLAAVSAISAVAQHQQQAKAASAQQNSLLEGYRQAELQTQEQQAEINATASEDMSDRMREALIERARVRASAAESGLTGISNQKLENEAAFSGGTDIARIEGNRARSVAQSQRQLHSARAQTQGGINTIKRPTLLGTGLNIIGGVAGSLAKK